jgi:tricorn protease
LSPTRFRVRSTVFAAATLAMALSAPGSAVAEPALWMRTPAISPDGTKIAFSYRGDLWTVPVDGGVATPVTVDAGYETTPVWSPDGQTLAYAADRFGNLDVFLVAVGGGTPTRLTFHSADEIPSSFTPDGKAVLFAAARLDVHTNVQNPHRSQPELYAVPTSGGRPTQILTTPAEHAVWDRAGKRLLYTDKKALEMSWRKHDNSSFARDVWSYDAASGRHTRLTAFGWDDRQPVWSPDERAMYYLSEKSGSFNVWRLALAADGRAEGEPQQVTSHGVHPVRFLSISRQGDLAYAYDGELWVRPAGAAESRRLVVEAGSAARVAGPQWIDVAADLGEFDLSPDGKEIAFVARGEVFVANAEFGTTRQITRTPEQERSVSFSPDGRSLLYAGERAGSWNLYRTDLVDADEPSFWNATALAEKTLLDGPEETFQPRFSPDGKQVAFLEDRTTLKVLDLASGKQRVVLPGDRNYSYADGDQWYQWSPDGRWLLVTFLSPGRWSSEVGLVPASGEGEVINLTENGYEDNIPRFNQDGTAMIFASDRLGMRRHGGWGSQDDIYATFFTQAAWDRFHLSPAELEQAKAKEEKAEKEKEKGKAGDDKAAKGKEAKKGSGADAEDENEREPKLADPVAMELAGLEDRTVRLTRAAAAVSDARLTPDGETLLVLARFEKGFDLWSITPRKDEAKLLAKLEADEAGGLVIDKEGKKAFLLADRKLMSVELDSGKSKPVSLDAKLELDAAAERAYLFEHAWRQTLQKFYVASLHGVDWNLMKTAYARFLPHIDNNWDFAELISELQGELNASHTGAYHRPRNPAADATASLAFFPDPTFTGPGVRIAEIIEGSPLAKAGAEIAVGTVIEAIDGVTLGVGEEWERLLNRKADQPVRLALFDGKAKRWQVVVKPIDRRVENDLLYERWVRSRRAEVERLSGGRLGYAHVRSMNDASYRQIFEDVFGKAVGKEAIVLDTRFNNGGNLVEALTIFLTGETYAKNVPRGRQIGSEPSLRWTKPSIVVMNEGNYSDAHCFPSAYKELGIGETVGMQVPGTCTAVWWENLQDRSLTFGIPQVGQVDPRGNYLENQHLDPDHEVDNDPAEEARGRDQQLEKAVEVLLGKLGPKR